MLLLKLLLNNLHLSLRIVIDGLSRELVRQLVVEGRGLLHLGHLLLLLALVLGGGEGNRSETALQHHFKSVLVMKRHLILLLVKRS